MDMTRPRSAHRPEVRSPDKGPKHRIAVPEGAMSKRLHRTARERLAREQGTVRKDWGGRIPVALVYPNVYSVGMANLGFLTVYGLLNKHEDIVCERVFLPSPDELRDMQRTGGRPVSMESQRSLDDFSVVAFSFSYENDYPNAAALLAMAGLPAGRLERSDRHPLILAGGPAVFLNPEPLASLIDVFVLGEAEGVIDDLLDRVRAWTHSGDRMEFLHALQAIEGVYVPCFYEPLYGDDGTLVAFEPKDDAPHTVKRRWVPHLDPHPVVSTVVTPDTEFSDIYLVEVGRGCAHRCRFCSTSLIYRPLRFRSFPALEPNLARGADRNLRLGLVSACLGDYPGMADLVKYLSGSGARISGPSLRLDALNDELLGILRKSGQKTVTLAPEAGSEPLRRRLGKPFSDDDILNAADLLAENGIFQVRLYFMVGLPGEEDADVEAIVDLAKRIRHRFLKAARSTARMGRITLSLNPFVPKPWSAFQWCAMAPQETIRDRLKSVRRALDREANISVTHGLAKWSYLQALFSRGDRRVDRFVLAGANPDARWKELFRSSSLNPDFFVHRERPAEELFPWDFIDHGITKATLYRDYTRSKETGQGGA